MEEEGQLKHIFKVCCLLVVVPILSGCVRPITATVSNVSANPGDISVAVPINISSLGSKEIVAIQLSLNYDQNSLQAKAIKKGTLTTNWINVSNLNVPGKLTIASYPNYEAGGGSLDRAGGELMHIIFDVKADAPDGRIDLDLSEVQLNEDLADKLVDGTFEVLKIAP